MSQVLGLTIGRTVFFRCNGIDPDRLIVVTPMDEYGMQEAISIDGTSHRTLSVANLYQKGAYRGIGFYDSDLTTILSRYKVETIKQRRIQFGRNPAPIQITDLNGKIISISNRADALYLLPKFAHCPEQIESETMMAMYARITAYWNDLLEKLNHHS